MEVLIREEEPKNAAEQARAASVLFTLLGRVIHGVPDSELLTALANERAFDEVPFVEGEESEQALKMLAAWNDGCSVPFSEKDFHDLSAEYTRLFVGTRRVVAPLWESVYFNKDRMVFQHETFEVRAMYARYGLRVDNFSHEPDDHLAYELLFLGHVLGMAPYDAEAGRHSDAAAKYADAVSFVVCHLLTWVPKWRALVQDHAQSDFYRGFSLLVEAALRQTEAVFAELSGECAAA